MIHLRDLTYAYPGSQVNTLHGLNLTIPTGEIFGFLGPSGAGKSTTVNILIGILKHYQGAVQVLGRDLTKITPEFFNRLGVAFETPRFYQRFTARENLSFFGSLYSQEKEPIDQSLAAFDLIHAADERVSSFSKGMKTRLNVCRAFLHQPELVFLDEPSSGLDPVNRERLIELLRQKREQGATLFLTTHDMQLAGDLCDRVAFVVEGKIHLIDSPRHLQLQYGRKQVVVERVSAGPDLLKEAFNLEGIGQNPAFLRALTDPSIETIHTQEARLEDIFIQVTGRKP
ncbi:ABC transporter ATP-binding protein [Marininema halotolerans]|nr:ABC transporter ATP-binding protein [Marininema halotolerans]